MKKRIVAVAIVAILLIATYAYAQTDNNVLQHILGQPVPKAPKEDTVHSHGLIEKIENISEDTVQITVKNDEKTLTIIVNKETYIGNATKSPPKPISYLEKDMKIDINYYEKSDKLIATSIVVIEW